MTDFMTKDVNDFDKLVFEFDKIVSDFNAICPCDRYMILNLYVEHGDSMNKDLKQMYIMNTRFHNQKLVQNIDFIDAGFDLITPYNHEMGSVAGFTKCVSNRANKLNFQVKCSAQMCLTNSDRRYNTGYYMYPRSSISKGCLRMANSTGIIDSGYRGPLIGMVDVVYEEAIQVHAYDKYFQICAPGLVPVLVNMVNSEEELGVKTVRGEGGFGSTGR
jgi:hypothetical protein